MCSNLHLLRSEELFDFLLKYPHLDHSDLVKDIARKITHGPYSHSSAILAGRYLEHLDVTDTFTKRTRRRIAGILRRFCETFGQMAIDDVPKQLAYYWLYKQGWSYSTRIWVALVLERLCDFGEESGHLFKNHMRGLRNIIAKAGAAK